MKLERCPAGHIYDRDKFDHCPHCERDGQVRGEADAEIGASFRRPADQTNNSAQAAVVIDSRITDVTIYLSGAQITRTGMFPVKAGVQRVVFPGLPAALRPESVQVSADDSLVIHSVEHAVNYLQPADLTGDITALQEKLEDLETQVVRENNQLELGKLEEELFSKNMCLAGSEKGLRAEELKSAVLFYNERMAAVRETRMACNKRIETLNREIIAIKNQLGVFRRPRPEPVSEVAVTVAAETISDAPERALTISYFVKSASWRPSYDIRARELGKDIVLHYKAHISQNTNENWEDVRLTLSTSRPSLSGAVPELRPRYLRVKPPPPPLMMAANRAQDPMLDDRVTASLPSLSEAEEIHPTAALMAPARLAAGPDVTATETVTNAVYHIAASYTILSGNGEKEVEIAAHALPAEYRCYSIPKLMSETVLLAAVSGWEHLNLIAGNASIYFENRFVGKTFLDPRKAEEKLDLSLDSDGSVIVSRIRGRDFSARTLAGGNVKHTRQWELTARNLKTVPIELELKDQVPVSANKQITVDVPDISGADLDRDTGILTWKFILPPGASRTLSVKYVVTGPKDMTNDLE